MCSGRVDRDFVLEAFRQGAGMVLVAACHLPYDCHYISGNVKMKARMMTTKKLWILWILNYCFKMITWEFNKKMVLRMNLRKGMKRKGTILRLDGTCAQDHRWITTSNLKKKQQTKK